MFIVRKNLNLPVDCSTEELSENDALISYKLQPHANTGKACHLTGGFSAKTL